MSVVDPIRAPLQFKILEYIKDHCCMSASASVIGKAIESNVASWGTINSSITQLKLKGLIVENNGRYHYYDCKNY